MSKPTIPIEELIKRYNREIMELKEKQQASHSETKAEPAVSLQQHLDTEYPIPDMQRDMENMLEEAIPAATTAITAQDAEDNAVRNEAQGSSSARAQTPPAQPEQGISAFPLSEENIDILPPSSPPPMEMSLGYLRAFITTGKGVLPIPNAQVIITRNVNGEELLEQAARTDNSGYTPIFILPAVSSIYSQTPEAQNPYTFYTIYVRADGFYPTRIREVPLYGGITAMQPIDLIPVAEGDDPNRERTITEGAPDNLK